MGITVKSIYYPITKIEKKKKSCWLKMKTKNKIILLELNLNVISTCWEIKFLVIFLQCINIFATFSILLLYNFGCQEKKKDLIVKDDLICYELKEHE